MCSVKAGWTRKWIKRRKFQATQQIQWGNSVHCIKLNIWSSVCSAFILLAYICSVLTIENDSRNFKAMETLGISGIGYFTGWVPFLISSWLCQSIDCKKSLVCSFVDKISNAIQCWWAYLADLHCLKKWPPFIFWLCQKLTDFNDFWYVKSWENCMSTAYRFAHLTCKLYSRPFHRYMEIPQQRASSMAMTNRKL